MNIARTFARISSGVATERYSIAQRLAGFAAVDTRQTRRVRQEGPAFGQQGCPARWARRRTISLVCSIIGSWSSPTGTSVARTAVMSAAWLIGYTRKPGWDSSPEAAERDLLANRGVSLEAGDRHQVEVEHRELRELGDTGLHGDGARGGIDADGEIVERELHHLPANVDRTAGVIGECLEIGNEDGLVVLVLERQTGAE